MTKSLLRTVLICILAVITVIVLAVQVDAAANNRPGFWGQAPAVGRPGHDSTLIVQPVRHSSRDGRFTRTKLEAKCRCL